MKIKYLAMNLLLGICILSGCSDNLDTFDMEFTEPSTTMVTNPFKPDDFEIPEGAEYISYGTSINIPDFEFLTCENNKVMLPITVENAGKEFSLGFCIFSDGIIQEYTSSVSNEKTTMQIFDLLPDSKQTIDFYIDNIENISQSDDVSFSYMTIINPEYIPSLANNGGELPHITSGGDSLHLHMDSPTESSDYKIYNEFDIHAITDEEAARFGILLDERDKSHSTRFILDSINGTGRPIENMIECSENGTLPLNLYSWTTNGNDSFSANGTFRVSFYKNHERINFNGDYDYIDIELKESYFTTAEVTLENINEGDFIYCIAAPIDNFKLTAQKSMTALILSPEDMPPIDEDILFSPVYVEPEQTGFVANTNGENGWYAVDEDEVDSFIKNNLR